MSKEGSTMGVSDLVDRLPLKGGTRCQRMLQADFAIRSRLILTFVCAAMLLGSS